MGLFGDLWDDAKQEVGGLIDDGAQKVGGLLNDVGLHSAANAVEVEGNKVGESLGANVGELQLGQTSDPTELVHGNPAKLRSTASRLTTFQSGFGQVADGLRATDTSHWEGAAADAFRAKFAPEPPKWSAASDAMGKAAASLQSYAGAVESAQSQARQAIDLWNQGQEATKQAVAAHNQQVDAYNTAADAYNAKVKAGQNPGAKPAQPGAFSDPGEAIRQEAEQVLTEARQARNTAAASAAAAVKAATSLAPKEPSFWSRLGDDASDALSVANLASTSVDVGIVDGVADIGKFARSLNPEDPWNQEHPAEYLAGLNGTLAGVADMVVNPKAALQGLAGTGWGSDPFQAFGKLVPNIALTVATDGGGAAADAGDVAADASAVSDAGDLSDGSKLTDGNPDVGKSAQKPDNADTGGDPVDLVTGNVLLRQTDVSLPGALPLVLRRVHKSAQRAGLWFGESWVSTFDQRILVMPDRVTAVFGDGQVLVYRRAEIEDPGTTAVPVAGPVWPMTRDGDGAYTVTDPQAGLTWRFERHPGYWQYTWGMGEFPLASLRDRAGHEIIFAYGPSGEPVSVTHSGGYRVDVSVEDGRVTALSLGGTVLMRYGYDGKRRLSAVTNSSGQPMTLSYDDAGDAGRVTGYTDRNGTSYRYVYDGAGRCIRGESPDGTYNALYEYRDGTTIWTDATGAVRTYEIDRSARITAETDPLGGVTRYTYDNRNRKTSETDPLGRVTGFEYDDRGNLVAVTRPDGEVARAAYDGRCQPVVLEEPGRGTWRQEFSARGNRVALTQPDGTVIRYAHDEAGHLAAVTGPDGLVTAVECDALGLPASVTEPGGAVTRYERDHLGRVTRVTAPDGAVTTMTWSVEGRPLTRVFPDGPAESWTWSPDGNLIRHVSPAGAATSYEYGPFDAITSVTGPDLTRTLFGYDGELRLASVEHGGLAWTYARDPAGRLVAETDYNGARTQYQLDAAGQVVRRLNAAGQETQFEYDALGNVIRQTATGPAGPAFGSGSPAGSGSAPVPSPAPVPGVGAGAGEVTEFGYDTAGDLVLARNASAEVTFERDALGRITAETCNGRTIRTAYDPAGRVTGRITPSGAESAWAYGPSGLPAELSAGGQSLRFGHTQDGREATRHLPGGITLSQDWDILGRLTGQILTGPAPGTGTAPGTGPASGSAAVGSPNPGAPTILQQRRYAYSPDGYVTGLSDLMTGTRAFTLDPAGRVTAVTGTGPAASTGPGPQWTEQYAYDRAGNITGATWPALSDTHGGGWLDTTPHGPRQVSGTLTRQAGNVRYSHDAAGRVVQRTRTRISRKPETWRYQWDADNRLTAVTTPDGTTWHYAYDPLGRRVLKQQVSREGTVLSETRFTWDGLTLAEQAELVPGTGDRDIVSTWDYRPGTFTPLTQRMRTSLRHAPQEVIDGEFYAIITDLTGSPTELIAPDGALVGYQQHSLWGTTLWHPDGASTPLRFPGQYNDPETGLHYNNQRFYDPVTGAYLSPDPLGLAPAPNPHTYVPNPHALIDPTGLAGDDLCATELASRIDRGNLKFSQTVTDHLSDLKKDGSFSRPYSNSKLLAQEIMDSGTPSLDPQGVPDVVRWDVPGTFRGRSGTWELVVDTKTSTVLHFLFTR